MKNLVKIFSSMALPLLFIVDVHAMNCSDIWGTTGGHEKSDRLVSELLGEHRPGEGLDFSKAFAAEKQFMENTTAQLSALGWNRVGQKRNQGEYWTQVSDAKLIDGKEIIFVTGGMGDPLIINRGKVTSVATDGFRSVEFVVNGKTYYLEALSAVFVRSTVELILGVHRPDEGLAFPQRFAANMQFMENITAQLSALGWNRVGQKDSQGKYWTQASDAKLIDGKEIIYVTGGGMGEPFIIRQGKVTSVATGGEMAAYRTVEFFVDGKRHFLETAIAFVKP